MRIKLIAKTTQLANIQEDNTNEETPRSRNHKVWMTETKRILMRNVGNSTKRDIETLFAGFGPLTEMNMPINRLARRQAGFAFVTFKMAKHAATAIFTLNGPGFQGRTLELTPNARDAPLFPEYWIIFRSITLDKESQLKQVISS